MPDQITFKAPATVNATAASTEIVAANNRRTYLLITNTTTTAVYLAVGYPAVLLSGIPLLGAGSSYEMLNRNANLSYQAIYAIHGGQGNKALAIQEAI